MKRSVFLITLAVLGFRSAAGWAQTPKLDKMTFSFDYASLQTTTCTGNGKLYVTLIFNTAMRDSTPLVTFGLNAPYSSPVPFGTKAWLEDNNTFVASFDINKDFPLTADGLYKFLIRKAYTAGGDTMAPALSDTIKNSADQPATLYISRQGKLTASTSKIDFDTTKAGTQKDRKLILKNVTCAEITLSEPSVSAPFFIPTSPDSVEVSPDSSYSLLVRFKPSSRAAFNRTLKVYYNINQKTDSLTVQLIGVSRGPEMVFLPAPALKFDTVYVDSTASKTVRLTNRKANSPSLSDTLKISSIALNPDTIFSVTPTKLTMAPGDTETVTVNFKPAEAKNYANTLKFTGNDFINKPGGVISFSASGTGQEKTPPPQVTTLIVDWPGGFAGYTNSSRLLISTPIDTSGIKEARWKFTQKDNDPPASAGDTLNGGAGKFISLKKDSSRFEIPLKITAGRWICYIWLEGTNGASGYRDAKRTEVTYDITPPTFSELPQVLTGWNRTFVGHTKADSLTVCWDASDSSAITEVRWKFTKTRLAPQNVDTTGSRRISSNCVTIPLKGKIIEDRWYCYVWLVDGSGNSSTATEIAVKYDVTAPQAPSVPIARNIPRNAWFNTNRSPLILTLKQIRDAAYVHWKFKTRPTPTTLHDDEGPLIVRNAPKDTVFSVIFNSPNWCGEDSLYFWLEDSAGNAKPERFAVTGYKFDMCSPVITRLRTGEAVVSKPTSSTNSLVVIDTVKIFDHTKVVRDSVLYRFGGSRVSQPPQRLRSVQGTKDRFIVEIPTGGITTRGIEYTIFAKDSLRNLGAGPVTEGLGIYCEGASESRWVPVRVRTTADGEFRIDKDGNAVPQPSGRDATNYALFSVPFELDKSAPKAVLEDDLGAYDRKLWRFFEYRPALGANAWVEYNSTAPTISPFMPGRAFFLIVSEANKVIDSGAGKTVTTGQPDTLALQDGWNLFGNPFNFPIHRDQLRLVNSSIPESPDTLRSILTYERRWSELNDIIEPWKGYAIYVKKRISTAPILLVICPIATIPPISKTLVPAETSAKDWTIHISAKAGVAVDSINYVGVRGTAADEYDDFDRMEPPVIGDYVSVYVDNEKWTKNPMKYTADFRPTSQEIYEWPLRVNSNTAPGEVILEFNGVANLPAEYEAYLVDEAYGVARNLRRNPEYRFIAGANGVEKSLKLLVGKAETLQKYSTGIALVPKAFELSQNFPNPFAAKYQQSFTAIRYTLPKSANVTVEVYNMLGQKVRTLVAGQAQAADYYLATWDGRDEAGKEVSSGVYVYRLLAESNGERFTSTKKLLLVK